MSVWQFGAVVDGYVSAHSSGGGMSANEADEIWAWMQAKEGRVQ